MIVEVGMIMVIAFMVIMVVLVPLGLIIALAGKRDRDVSDALDSIGYRGRPDGRRPGQPGRPRKLGDPRPGHET